MLSSGRSALAIEHVDPKRRRVAGVVAVLAGARAALRPPAAARAVPAARARAASAAPGVMFGILSAAPGRTAWSKEVEVCSRDRGELRGRPSGHPESGRGILEPFDRSVACDERGHLRH